ncbi:MAG: TonB-dependent receptor [Candidatus Cyclobacteriaceae bacterium M2_1C_046]
MKAVPFIGYLFFACSAYCQVNINGYIQDQSTGERLPGATITLKDTHKGIVSNNYGFFSIDVPKKAIITINYLGYSALTVNTDSLGSFPYTFNLHQNINELEEVVIQENQLLRVNESEQMSLVSLPVEQVKNMPVLLGEKDILKTIQMLPGVQSGKEGSAGIYVRGGGPDQNLIILDDAIVYNAFHMFGFFSVFNSDAISSIDLYKGGFPARYGGRLSSVLDIKMKDGNRKEWHGEGGIGILSSRLTLEGPLIKDKASVLISGRRSYADLFVNLFGSKDNSTRIYFGDLNIKANYDFSKKSKLIFSNYFGKDVFFFRNSANQINNEVGYNWGNITSTIRWNYVLNSKIFLNTSLIYSKYKFNIFENTTINEKYYERLNSSEIRDLAAKTELDYFLSPVYHLKLGLSAIQHRFSPRAIVVEDTDLNSVFRETIYNFSDEYAGYIENIFSPNDHLKMNLGLRYSTIITDKNKYPQLEPRLSGAYKLTNNLSLKGSYAYTQQNVHLLSSSGIGLPTDLWTSATDNVPPQRAWQIAIGAANYFDKRKIEVSVELFYKEMMDILAYKDGASFLFLGNTENGTDITPIDWEQNVTSGYGESAGIELFLHRKTGKLSGWLGYTLSYTRHQFDEINNSEPFWARHDRRHDVSIVTSYEVKPNIKLNVNWVYGTGNAISIPQYSIKYYEHDLQYLPVSAYNHGERNSFRAAPYHRLDIGVQFNKKKKWGERVWEVGLYNAYMRSNPFFYTHRSISGNGGAENKLMYHGLFPLVPSISYSFKF